MSRRLLLSSVVLLTFFGSSEQIQRPKRREAGTCRNKDDMATATASGAKLLISETINAHKVAIFSKSYCPFCKKAKAALESIHAAYFAVELDHRDDGEEVQDALKEITAVRSVPQVFINGKFIGGGDDTVAKVQDGTVKKLLAA